MTIGLIGNVGNIGIRGSIKRRLGVPQAADDWSWATAILDTMVADEYKKINLNTVPDVALDRTLENFDGLASDGSGTWANNDACLVAVGGKNGLFGYSVPSINLNNGSLIFHGAGHADLDGTIFKFHPNSFLWDILVYPPKIIPVASGRPTINLNVIGATQANPVVVEFDAPHGAVVGDEISFASIGGMTELNGNTYQVGAIVDTTHLSLMAIGRGSTIDGTGFTAYTSGGIASIIWNPMGGSTYYTVENKDGEKICAAIHSYKAHIWIGGNKYLLAGDSVGAGDGGASPGRLWFLDEDASPMVYRGWHDVRTDSNTFFTIDGGAGYVNGPIAYNPNDGLVYTGETSNTIFNFKVRRWHDDFLGQDFIDSDPGVGFLQGSHAVIYTDANGRRNFFAHYSDAGPDFRICTDIEAGGTPVLSAHNYASFNTTGVGINTGVGVPDWRRAYFWDDLNETIIYWGGESTIREIVPNLDLDAFTTQQVTSSPTGDVPSGGDKIYTGAKIPDVDAYMLVADSDIYLYKRS